MGGRQGAGGGALWSDNKDSLDCGLYVSGLGEGGIGNMCGWRHTCGEVLKCTPLAEGGGGGGGNVQDGIVGSSEQGGGN